VTDGGAGAARVEVAVGAVGRRDDELLVLRRGSGPARGEWSLPGGPVRVGEDLREATVREVEDATGLEVVVSEFVAWSERIEVDAQPPAHVVTLHFAVDLLDPLQQPSPGAGVAEVDWVALEDLDELRLAPGVAELLVDVGVLAPAPGVELRAP
jgi:ADP-ribose pyrophosphatase YjhB (NUDIX family)